MNPTSLSLLDRLKAARPDASAWSRLQDIYLPLVRNWLSRIPALGDEAEDLAQEIFIVLVRELPRFERQRLGSFRAWLRQVTVNRVRTHSKQRRCDPAIRVELADRFLDHLSDPHSELAREWDREHDQYVFQKLLTIVHPDFTASTWEAFRRFALDGHPAARVAEELGLTENAVLQAKSRILKRLREEAGEFLE